MPHTRPVAPSDLRHFCEMPGFALDPATVARQAPDASHVFPGRKGECVGRCSLWWNRTPELEGKRVGYLGHFAVTEEGAAGPVLEAACRQFAREGCAIAIGPVDGNTWQRYRLITERGDEPPFFLEPDNPDEWPGYFLAAGFTPLAHYYSALNENLATPDPRLPFLAQKAADAGYHIRSLDPNRFEDELRRVHTLSLLSFQSNFLYSPISEAEFLAQYTAVRPYVRPEFALLAERENELAGFLFAIPDLARAQRGGPMDTVILKTLAVHPDHGGHGLGSYLMALCEEQARQAGFTRAIHALFHESNRSGRISSHTGRNFRRYTLFARSLEGPR